MHVQYHGKQALGNTVLALKLQPPSLFTGPSQMHDVSLIDLDLSLDLLL
jgi:hypothetical protein